jgi:putative tricarboxylic transport membrane protein
MSQGSGDGAPDSSNSLIKSQVDLGSGLLLIAVALVGYFGTLALRFGSLTAVGPGLMPRSVAVLVGTFGAVLVVTSFFAHGPRLEKWAVRGPLFVLGSVLAFALTIRGSTISLGDWHLTIPQLGLAVAGPLAVIISALADRETKPLELAVFTVGLTVACLGMFKYILRLPLPILPFGWGPF